jgi:hypothetical protein
MEMPPDARNVYQLALQYRRRLDRGAKISNWRAI